MYHERLLHPFLDRVIADRAPLRALDLGCGTGVVSLALAVRDFEVVGIDHSPDMLAIARRKAEAAGLADRCSFETGDVRNLRFADGEFDCVTCQGLLHHLEEFRSCLVELERVLAPGGSFYISEPCREETIVKRLLLGVWRTFKRSGRTAEEAGAETVEEPISSEDLRSELTALGLDYEVEHLAHIPPLRRRLRDGTYLAMTRLLSFPWRRRKGDLVFVFGEKNATAY